MALFQRRNVQWPEQLLRHAELGQQPGKEAQAPSAPLGARLGAQLGGWTLSSPSLYRIATGMMATLEAPLAREGWVDRLPPPLSRWTSVRPMPAFQGGFRRWWNEHGKGGKGGKNP